jgi:hypothetical protein
MVLRGSDFFTAALFAIADLWCSAISGEIERGILPCDRDGAYIDELLIAASLPEAETL